METTGISGEKVYILGYIGALFGTYTGRVNGKEKGNYYIMELYRGF